MVANWLEANFHVMEKNVAVNTEKANAALMEICKCYCTHCDVRGIKWFFDRVPVSIIDEGTAATVLSCSHSSALSFLLSLFNFSQLPFRHQNLKKIVEKALSTGWNPLVDHVVSTGVLTPLECASCLEVFQFEIHCSKVFKRLVCDTHITEEHIYRRTALSRLITTGCTGLVEWFINHVHLTSDQLHENRTLPFRMWKVLQRVFPDLAGENLVSGKLGLSMATSPLHIEYAMRNHGISLDRITQLVEGILAPLVPDETKLWARKSTTTAKPNATDHH
ncbi:hypothetical protein Pelo_17770 [Pelomyxa schiedti]|nr:hypothetical protein Pelo_17770 [Pelomyxa schiedti]